MGFTQYEKESLRSLIRTPIETNPIRDKEIPPEIIKYLKSVDLLHHLHDYALFPLKHVHRVNKAENIIFGKFFNADLNVFDMLEEIVSFLTPTFRIQVDFGFIIKSGINPENLEYRYVFPQRSLKINTKMHINSLADIETFLNEFKNLNRNDLMQKTYEIHQNQSLFDKSGFQPYYLLNMVVFLAKI